MGFNLKSVQDVSSKNPKMFIIIQILLGILIGYLIYVLSLIAIRADRLVIDEKYDLNGKKSVQIIDGYAETSSLHGKHFNTQSTYLSNYLPIRPSVNLKGGAQFTYSLWLNVENPEEAKNKCIFLKGDANKYDFKVIDNVVGYPKETKDRIVYCPMLSFGDEPMEFVVSFNTFNKMNEELKVTRITNDNSNMRQNLLSLFTGKWVLITIVFEDNIPINDFENGVVLKFYINDTLYHVGKFSGGLKQNNGDLYLFPNDYPVPNCKVSNFTYFNYALTPIEIRGIADRGPSTKLANPPTFSFISPSMMSDYNRLDIYNI